METPPNGRRRAFRTFKTWIVVGSGAAVLIVIVEVLNRFFHFADPVPTRFMELIGSNAFSYAAGSMKAMKAEENN